MIKQQSLPKVLVMMATYNGEKYVAEQIESILVQEHVEITLVITDDLSTDHTATVCQAYSKMHPNILFKKNEINKGSMHNFLDMLHASDVKKYDYFAFADQDDIWFSEKIIRAVEKLEDDQETPSLYYSDVINYDFGNEKLVGKGKEYYPFISYSQSLKTLLLANWASGNTMVFNRSLAKLAQKYYPENFPRYHDSWIHLIALSCGKTFPDLEHAYIIRRIYENNEVGTRGFGVINMRRIVNAGRMLLSTPSHDLVESAKCLKDGYYQDMSENARMIIDQFCNLNLSFKAKVDVVCCKDYALPSKIDTLMAKMRILLRRA